MVIVGKRVIGKVNRLRNTCAFEVFNGVSIAHQPQPNVRITLYQILVNMEDARRQTGIVDELYAIFLVVRNDVFANDDLECRAYIIMKPDLDSIVSVVANDVIFYQGFTGPIQIDAVVTVVFKCVRANHASFTSVCIVHAITGVNDAIMQKVKRLPCLDPIVTVLDGESYD